ncbi:hypothetical protein Tco_0933489, partial [Tanacetum coccineum]
MDSLICSIMDMGVFAQCELQFEVHGKLLEVFIVDLLPQVLGFAPTWSQKV